MLRTRQAPALRHPDLRARRLDPRAIEDESFPFEHLSQIAEVESWRKEINRPIYHLHKWWAQRLGSVFRGILIGAFSPPGVDLMERFYTGYQLRGAEIFDPFMGSGTTVGEALKLGARAIGRDINPVAYWSVKHALAAHSESDVIRTFHEIEGDVRQAIQKHYRRPIEGSTCDVLYYFWVMVVACSSCKFSVDLFSSYVFASNAYPARKPVSKVVCPSCGSVDDVEHHARQATCRRCCEVFDPHGGPAQGKNAVCPNCGTQFSIIAAIRASGAPPSYRMYAKLVLLENNKKIYLAADDQDVEQYELASAELRQHPNAFPVAEIRSGYNTDQVLNYGYSYWHQMFNDRQLLSLGVLADRIRQVDNVDLRGLFALLFSGTLEFNNMFASYKGEGTGAVRHMFSHHILKPERTPLEANVWGTPKSSGAFSTLFISRLLRALKYRDNPFEIRPVAGGGTQKTFGISKPMGREAAESFADFVASDSDLYLSCGDSGTTDISDETVQAVVTDPPFFDNVNYSELADFFYVWQRHILGDAGSRSSTSTRSELEVQHQDADVFSGRLEAIWRECHRILDSDGLLLFSYHHSRPEGWHAIFRALSSSKFVITATQPVKSEMSVATPKSQAREPIDLDVIFVCRKLGSGLRSESLPAALLDSAVGDAAKQMRRFNEVGRRLSRGDVRVIVMAHILRHLSRCAETPALVWLRDSGLLIEQRIAKLNNAQNVATIGVPQLTLSFG